MGNLLSAGFLRLRKSRSFRVSMAVMAATGILEAVYSWRVGRQFREHIALDMRYMFFVLIVGIILSAFCSLFVGTEYSDGAIRNKFAAGYTRAAVYLCNLTLCITAGILMCLGYIAAFLTVGIPLLGFFQTELWIVLCYTLEAFLMTAALAAVFTMLSMLHQNKTVVVVISIFLAYFLLFLGIFLHNRLSEPELTPVETYFEGGQIILRETAPNLNYVGGLKRAVYQFLFALPGCQAIQLCFMQQEALLTLPVFSGTALLVCTGLGLFFFRKKDIK